MGEAATWFIHGDGVPEKIDQKAENRGILPQDTTIITGTMQQTLEHVHDVFPQI